MRYLGINMKLRFSSQSRILVLKLTVSLALKEELLGKCFSAIFSKKCLESLDHSNL